MSLGAAVASVARATARGSVAHVRGRRRRYAGVALQVLVVVVHLGLEQILRGSIALVRERSIVE